MAASESPPQRSTNDQIAEIAERHVQRYQWGDDTLHGAVTEATREGFGIAADIVRELAAISPWATEHTSGDGVCFFCGRMAIEDRHDPDCLWAKAKQAVGEEVTHG